MSATSIYIRKRRAQLLCLLGDRCAWCGSVDDLEVDCIEPQGHEHHTCGPYSRLKFYLRQLDLRNVQLLCARCHAKKTALDYFPPCPF